MPVVTKKVPTILVIFFLKGAFFRKNVKEKCWSEPKAHKSSLDILWISTWSQSFFQKYHIQNGSIQGHLQAWIG